jgi:hypothetical protein
MKPTLQEMQEQYYELMIKESFNNGYHINGEFLVAALIDDMKEMVLILEDEVALKEWYEGECMG